jgi:hypothetical protein
LTEVGQSVLGGEVVPPVASAMGYVSTHLRGSVENPLVVFIDERY